MKLHLPNMLMAALAAAALAAPQAAGTITDFYLTNLFLRQTSSDNYTISLTLGSVINGGTASILQLADSYYIMTQEGRYLGFSTNAASMSGNKNGLDYANTSSSPITGKAMGWLMNSGSAGALAGSTLTLSGSSTGDTSFTYTKGETSRSFTMTEKLDPSVFTMGTACSTLTSVTVNGTTATKNEDLYNAVSSGLWSTASDNNQVFGSVSESTSQTIEADTTYTGVAGYQGTHALTVNANLTMATAVIKGALTLNGSGTLTAADVIIAGGGSLSGTPTAMTITNLSVLSGAEASISGGSVTTLSAEGGTTNISGGTVTTLYAQSGTTNISGGTVTTLNAKGGTAGISGGTVSTLNLNGGTVEISGGTLSAITLNSGTFRLKDTYTQTLAHNSANKEYAVVFDIEANATLQLQSEYKFHETLSDTLKGAGTLRSLAPTQSSQLDGFKKTIITGDTSNFTGTWELETVQLTGGNKRVMGILNGPNDTNTFGGVVSFTGAGNAHVSAQTQQSMLVLAKDYSLGGLKSDSQLRDVMVMGGAANIDPGQNDIHNTEGTARTLTITGNNADNATFSGIIHQSITLNIAANASQAFDNATLNGNITVQTGGQLVSSGSTLGTGATLTVENGAKVKEHVANITLGSNTSQVTWDEGSVYTLTGAGNNKEINLTETASETEGVIHLASGIKKVELNGVRDVALTAGTIGRDLLINNNGADAAGIITASGEYTMNGSISGSGNLQWNVAGGDTSKVTFNGSLKDWNTSGNSYQNWSGLVANGTGKVTAVIAGTLTEDADRTVNMAFNTKQGTLELTVQRDAEFTQGVDVSSLTVESGTSKLSGGSQTLSVSGATTVKEGATLDLARNNGNIGTLSGAGTVKSTAGTAAMTVKADFTGALEAVGGNLTLSAAETAIYLQSLTIQGGSTVTATPSVSMGSNPETPTTLTEGAPTPPTLTVQAGTGDATFAGDLTLGSTAVTLGQELKVTGSLTLGTGNTLTLTNGMALPVNSSSLTLFYAESVTDWNGPVAADTVFSSISGVTNLQKYTLNYDAETKALTLSVPEPATATLSLLALVGLAARRRRKG